MTFKIGDIVQLKSGGPRMTVLEVDNLIAAMWFADGRAETAGFYPAMLEHVKYKVEFNTEPVIVDWSRQHVRFVDWGGY